MIGSNLVESIEADIPQDELSRADLPCTPDQLLVFVDSLRAQVGRSIVRAHRNRLGQYFTPRSTAVLLASLFEDQRASVRVLDAGAGIGSLTAAWVAAVACHATPPETVDVTLFEIDDKLIPWLNLVMRACENVAARAGTRFSWVIHSTDFVQHAEAELRGPLLAAPLGSFDCAILNPPYKQFSSDSDTRRSLRSVGIEAGNLYAAFLALSLSLLRPGGELVAITPRSFCNGPYFRPFRCRLLSAASLTTLHAFTRRDQVFSEDEVLQENVVLRLVKGVAQAPDVAVSVHESLHEITVRLVPFTDVVKPDDADSFIHIVSSQSGAEIASRVNALPCSLDELGLKVSTGRVVGFRSRDALRSAPERDTVPLIYPCHFDNGSIEWPKPESNKPNAIAMNEATRDLLVPNGYYVFVKRFSAKEERRRVVAAVCDPSIVPGDWIGVENHLNYFHVSGVGLPQELALGLAAYLNSTLVDEFFRQFSGHTQVNATDLRKLRYPTPTDLLRLANDLGGPSGDQCRLDDSLDRLLI